MTSRAGPGIIYREGGAAVVSDQRLHLDACQASPNGSAPRCQHCDGLVPAAPRSDGCQQCRGSGQDWASLLVCVTCGWVACGNDSPGRHASAHYAETDHPVAARLTDGSAWCFVHQRQV